MNLLHVEIQGKKILIGEIMETHFNQDFTKLILSKGTENTFLWVQVLKGDLKGDDEKKIGGIWDAKHKLVPNSWWVWEKDLLFPIHGQKNTGEHRCIVYFFETAFTKHCTAFAFRESEAGNVVLHSDNLSVETMKKWETPTGCGCGLLFVMLLMPLHGAVIAQHHLPQSLTEICQAGNVAVKGDMLPTERDERKRNQGQTWSFFQDKTCYYESSNCDAYYIII